MCKKLEVTSEDNFQDERRGVYNLQRNVSCDGRPVWKQSSSENYLYYIAITKFWAMGDTPCGMYVGKWFSYTFL